MFGKTFLIAALTTFVATLSGLLALAAVGCDSEQEEPTMTTTPWAAATGTAEGVQETTPKQISGWLEQEVEEYEHFLDVIEGTQEVVRDLIAQNLTRDEALDDIEQRKERLAQSWARFEDNSPPASARYGTDLEEIHTFFAKALEAHMAALDSTADYIAYVPPDGGMPTDLVKATGYLEEATARVEEASSLSRKALGKGIELAAEIILLMMSD